MASALLLLKVEHMCFAGPLNEIDVDLPIPMEQTKIYRIFYDGGDWCLGIS